MSAIPTSNSVEPFTEERVYGPRLVGGWRIAGISAWTVIWLMSLAAFLAAIITWYRWDSTPAARLVQSFSDLTSDAVTFYVPYQAGIQQLGMSLAFYAGFFAVLRLISGSRTSS